LGARTGCTAPYHDTNTHRQTLRERERQEERENKERALCPVNKVLIELAKSLVNVCLEFVYIVNDDKYEKCLQLSTPTNGRLYSPKYISECV